MPQAAVPVRRSIDGNQPPDCLHTVLVPYAPQVYRCVRCGSCQTEHEIQVGLMAWLTAVLQVKGSN